MREYTRPLRLLAATPADLNVLSALLHNAVVHPRDIVWSREKLFMCCDADRVLSDRSPDADCQRETIYRSCRLRCNHVNTVRSLGLSPRQRFPIVSLALLYEPGGDDGPEHGRDPEQDLRIHWVFSHGRVLEMMVECIDVSLIDICEAEIRQEQDQLERSVNRRG